MKQNISLAMNLPNPKTRTVPRYSDKFKDVLERAMKKQEPVIVKPPKQPFFYRVRSVGVGAFSFVYLVLEEESGSLYAQKSISKKKVSPELFTEIKMHLTLHHPNIIELYHICSDEDYVHLIMEYAGDSLFSLRKNKVIPMKMSQNQIAMILKQITEALLFLHSKGFVHADLKLQNVLYLESVVKVCDFGFSHQLEKEGKQVIGTLEYLAPQYVQGKKSGFARDIWALGIIAYELLTGTNPLENMSQNEKWSKMLKITGLPQEEYPQGISPTMIEFLNSTLCNFQHRKSAEQLLRMSLLNNENIRKNLENGFNLAFDEKQHMENVLLK